MPKFREPQEKETINDIYELMTKCWCIHPEKRPSFEELREDLEGVYHGYY